MYHQLLLKCGMYPAVYKFQQYQTTRCNSYYSTWLNNNQLYDDDQQPKKHSVSTPHDSTQHIQ